HGLSNQYGRLLAWSLDHRFAVTVFALAIFAAAIPLNSRVGRDWIPADDQNELTLHLNMAVGTSLDANVKILKEIAEQVKQVSGVEFVNPYVGAEITGHSHTYIRLVDISRRNFTQEDVARDIRKIMKQYPNIRSRVNWPSALGEGESYSGINVRSEEHTSELQSHLNLVCRLLLEKKNKIMKDGVKASPLPTVNTTGYIDQADFLGTINADTNKTLKQLFHGYLSTYRDHYEELMLT